MIRNVGCCYPGSTVAEYVGLTSPLYSGDHLGNPYPPACDYEGGASLRPGESDAAFAQRMDVCQSQMASEFAQQSEPGFWEQTGQVATLRLLDKLLPGQQPQGRGAPAGTFNATPWLIGGGLLLGGVLLLKRRRRR